MSSREEFEAWASGFFAVPDFSKNGEGTYYKQWIRNSWAAWQASRQALEIKLPETEWIGDSYKGDWALSPEDVSEALRKAGVRVKA